MPERFHQRNSPRKVIKPTLVKLNKNLAKELGFDRKQLESFKGTNFLAGQFILPKQQIISCAYSGHQFGQFNPNLGDGRAHLLGEFESKDKKLYELALKGSGQTQFSRRGDGLATLGSVMREYIISEAMSYLGIPTTRSLALITTGEKVQREKLFYGAILARIASSHIRVGTFEYFLASNDLEGIKILADFAINRHYPKAINKKNSYIEFLNCVIKAQAKLISSWMGIGFIHGVMNTDNTAISGETIDFGPCAFMDEYSSNQVFSSIDYYGRYAYNNQMLIGKWNVARFAECLLHLLDCNQKKAIAIAEKSLENYDKLYFGYYLQVMSKKLGFKKADKQMGVLGEEFLQLLERESLDFTNSFRNLSLWQDDTKKVPKALQNWFVKWQKLLDKNKQAKKETKKILDSANPVFIARNHLVEKAIRQAEDEGDYTQMNTLLEVLTTPYQDNEQFNHYKLLPTEKERVHKTFCGT